MSEFYTNVQISRGNILLRGISNGKAFQQSIKYKPYYFVPSKTPTEYTNLKGESLARIDFDSTTDAKEFLAKYEGVDNFSVYGFAKPVYNFIHDNYKDMEYDASQVAVVYTDIETAGNTYAVEQLVRIKRESDGVEKTCRILDLYKNDGYLVFDEERSEWVDREYCCYIRSNGFPEAERADNPITAITLRKGNLTIVLTTLDYVSHKEGVIAIICKDERELLFKFIDVWKKFNPDILTGWNIEFFDVPYIINRINKVLGDDYPKQLSPWGQIHDYTTENMYGVQKSYKILGVSTIDMMAAYQKFTFKNQEAWTLNHIAHVELGEAKTDYSEYESLLDLYLKNPQKYIEYNIQDNDLVVGIADKTGLLDQIIAVAYDAGINYNDAFTSVLLWEVIIKNYLSDKGIIIPMKTKKSRKDRQIMGAFVKPPIPKKYKWVVGLDLDSLYPHLIMQYNISPETFVKCIYDLRFSMDVDKIVEGDLKKNFTIASLIDNQDYTYTPNGSFFRKDIRGFLPSLMDTMYSDRKKFKKLMIKSKIENEANPSKDLERMISRYNNMQMAKKICLNSAYGACLNEYFMWFNMDIGEAITYGGQLSFKWIVDKLNKYLNKLLKTKNVDYVVAGDTDSVYLTLDALVEQVMPNETDNIKIRDFLEEVCSTKINPFIEKSYKELKEYTNAYEQKMSMKVESISSTGMWKAKKRYALNVLWDEGVKYDHPKLKIKGMEVVQSSTPAVCKDPLKKAIVMILEDKKDDLVELISNFEKEFKTLPFESISYTSRITDVEKYFDPVTGHKKGALHHIRGSLNYNKLIKQNKLDLKYQKINNGDKVKACYLKMPNPIASDAMSVYNRLPAELNLSPYIDYDTQFEKEFKSVVDKLALLAGWDLNNTATLENFFS